MTSFLSFFAVPSFPAYTGPYSVGTREIEIPTAELSSPAPDGSISTISYRIFYPCSPDIKHKKEHIYWLPSPQHEYFAAYARFSRASPWLASLLSYFPLLSPLFHTIIPALPSAPILPSTHRWPVSIFSHGLGGSKNAYSALCGSLASYGLVVVALDHRDGSSPVSFVRTNAGTLKDAEKIEFRRLGHAGGEEVDRKRDQQLKIRCWEMGAAWESIGKLDRGETVTNLAEGGDHAAKASAPTSLEDFKQKFDVHSPGRVAWIGHSFGAATVAQFVKSVAYHRDGIDTLLAHPPLQALRQQIIPASPTVFLDLWAQPLKSVHMQALFKKPLPCYDASNYNTNDTDNDNHTTNTTTTTSAAAPLAILSDSFFKWKANLTDTIRVISPPPPSPPSLSQPHSNHQTPPPQQPTPHLFYPPHSAHLSQSDFGTLFPWFSRRVFKAEDPHRTISLNVRAVLEALRRAGVEGLAAGVSEKEGDGEGGENSHGDTGTGTADKQSQDPPPPYFSDSAILDSTHAGRVKGWIAIPLTTLEDEEVVDPVAAEDTAKAVTEDVVKQGMVVRGAAEDEGYDSPGNGNTIATPFEAVVEGEVKRGR